MRWLRYSKDHMFRSTPSTSLNTRDRQLLSLTFSNPLSLASSKKVLDRDAHSNCSQSVRLHSLRYGLHRLSAVFLPTTSLISRNLVHAFVAPASNILQLMNALYPKYLGFRHHLLQKRQRSIHFWYNLTKQTEF